MQPLYELNIEFFKFVSTPLPLILTNRQWYTISKDPHARAEWLINKYGRAHALLHAVRLGNSYITPEVIQALLSRKAILYRYFVQRLLMHFGNYDEKLIELKIEHNVNQVDFDRIRAFQKELQSPWAKLATKGNDMELFHFLSTGPLVINFAPQKLLQNINEIKDLIINKKFIPFPLRPKPTYEDTQHEVYSQKDGYENSRQLNVVARATSSGFSALLILFPPTPPSDWECSGLIDLGFKLTDTVMEEAFHLFEHRLSEISDILISAFQLDINDVDSIKSALLILFPPTPPSDWECPGVHYDILISAFQVIRKESKSAIALNFYNVELSVHSNLYYWILKTYGPDSVMWKEIGYHEICNDINEFVMQGALSILFPTTPPSDWECPGVRSIVTRLNQRI
ncbi:hypothetical protein RhiirA4_461642 [Rhizophagus irregularis]|uniref:Uncharacterized protein n=1 Tax=Rhizophagus irregularis TaxID=588596 RepID=A0A2I1GJA0_9GLOM|nr:hypothetical protein RhiirA4_461642 [Rhizophagus irregularis]